MNEGKPRKSPNPAPSTVSHGQAATPSGPAPSADPIASPSSSRTRTWVTAFIGVWLAVQLVLPASYYFRGDPTEERFAWRMFSDIHAAQRYCIVAVIETRAAGSTTGPVVRDVDLALTIHGGWERHIQRYRRVVIDRFLRWRCASAPGVSAVEVRRTCPGELESRMPSSADRLSCAGPTSP